MILPPGFELSLLRYDPARVAEWEACLTADERRRYDGFSTAKRRREFLLGRAVARCLLARRLGCRPSQVPIHLGDEGAPQVAGALKLSISHAGDRAAAAVGPRRLGVDLERIVTRQSGIERFFLAPEERPSLDAAPVHRAEALITLWTLKEAVLKARGTGLRTSPKKVRAEIDWQDGTATLVVAARSERWEGCFRREGSYLVAVAYERPRPGEPAFEES